MTRKKIIVCVLSILLIISTIIMYGCKTNEGKSGDDNALSYTSIPNITIPDNSIPDNAIPDDGKSFPFSFRGTWKKDNFNHTLTFTKDTLKAGNQSYTWIFQSVSGDVYKIKPDNYNYEFTLTIKLVNGNLVISGDSAVNSENNWNGTWKKQ